MKIPFWDVLKNFSHSEKAVASGALVIIVTAFVFTNRITVDQWMDYTQMILGIYVGGKAIQGVAAALGAGGHKATEAVEIAKAIHDRVVALETEIMDDETDDDAGVTSAEGDSDE